MSLLHDLLDDAARTWPDRTAVSDGTAGLTHRELAEASVRAASWLHGLGVRRGARVVVVGPSSVIVPVLVHGVSRLGAVFCVLHEQTRGRPLAHVLTDAEPALVIADDPVSASAAGSDVAVVDLDEARREAFTGRTAQPSEPPGTPPLPVDPVCLIYTSGSTADPKAVVTTHQQAVFSTRAIQSALSYHPDDVVACPLPLSFDYGLYQLFLGAVSGAHVRLARSGPALLRDLVVSRATVLASVPSVAETLVRLLARGPGTLPPLRLLTNTGAAMPPQPLTALRAALPGLKVQLMFGLTECKRATIMPPDADLDRPGACGLALPGTEVFAIDADGTRLPPGAVGELVVRGPNVMAGYWRRPDLTALRFPREEGLFPQLRTGDHGWVDEDGYLYFLGRFDDIYKERGYRVSAIEVEAAARRVPGVRLAAVVPPQGARPALLAVVGELTTAEVLDGLRSQIEEFKIPRHCVVLDRLPLTRNGKIDRTALLAEVGHG